MYVSLNLAVILVLAVACQICAGWMYNHREDDEDDSCSLSCPEGSWPETTGIYTYCNNCPGRTFGSDCTRTCPDDFTLVENEHGVRVACLKAVDTKLSWADASDNCATYNDHSFLAVVNSWDENYAMTKFLTSIGKPVILPRSLDAPLKLGLDPMQLGIASWSLTAPDKPSNQINPAKPLGPAARFPWTVPDKPSYFYKGCDGFWGSGQRKIIGDCQSSWQWMYEGGLQAVDFRSYTNWNAGEPNCAKVNDYPPESCLELLGSPTGTWNDLACEVPLCSVCQIQD